MPLTFERIKDERDGKEYVVNPPVIPEYERRLEEAKSRADHRAIAQITAEYTEEREKVAKELEDAAKEDEK